MRKMAKNEIHSMRGVDSLSTQINTIYSEKKSPFALQHEDELRNVQRFYIASEKTVTPSEG